MGYSQAASLIVPTICAIHVHTTYSDGTEGVQRILADARAAGIDVLMITDHHTLAAARHGWAGWHDGVLVVVGYEHSDPQDENHLLVFGLEHPLEPTLPAKEYVQQAVDAGAIVFIAHPVERRARRGRIRPYPWTAGMNLPFQGIEVWNFMSLWVERFTPRRAVLSYLLPGLTGERPDPDTIGLWDRCATHRPAAGMAGLDAHALKVRWGPFALTLFRHARHFQGPLTVVETPVPLSGHNAPADTALILTHLARGNSAMGIARLGPLRDIVTRVNGRACAVWGQTFTAHEPLSVGVTLPQSAQIRLLRDGRVEAERKGREADFSIHAPGLYRMEILRGRAIWVLSNHFRVVS